VQKIRNFKVKVREIRIPVRVVEPEVRCGKFPLAIVNLYYYEN
jgi:hypothetical protein